MSEWQPIETAPKNSPGRQEGTHILLYFPEMGICEGWWWDSHPEHPDDINKGWMICDGSSPGDDNKPTHWVYLPDPPFPNQYG